MSPVESIFFWIAMLFYALSTSGYIYAIVFRKPENIDKLIHLTTAGLLLHSAAITARFIATGHLPWAGDYEVALMSGWFIIAGTIYVSYRRRGTDLLAATTVPVVLIIMGYGAMRNPVLTPMEASLKSFWLYIHVIFASISYGAYCLAVGAGVSFLLKTRDKSRNLSNPVLERLPSLEKLEELIFRYVVFGFITHAIMLASGAIWAKDLWGSYWTWDPVETWSLVSWLMYGIVIHLRVTMGWRGKKLAWLAIGSLTTVFIMFFGVNFVVDTSKHFFNVVR